MTLHNLSSTTSSSKLKGCEQGSEEIPVQPAGDKSMEIPLKSLPNEYDISRDDQSELSRHHGGTDVDSYKHVIFSTSSCPNGIDGSGKADLISDVLKDGLVTQEPTGSDSFYSAESPQNNSVVDFGHFETEDPKVTTHSEEGNESDVRLEKSPKRKTARRNVKTSHKHSSRTTAGSNDVAEETLPDYRKKPLTRTNSASRKKRHSSKKRKPKEEDRVQLGLDKAEELTERVDTCLDIINDLLTLTSYNKNENETEESLLQKIDTLIQKFTDSESDVSISRRSNLHSRRKEMKIASITSDSNTESISELYLGSKHSKRDGEASGLGQKKEGETNGWGHCSLEDSLKVMSELVGNIKGSVYEQKRESGDPSNSAPDKSSQVKGTDRKDFNVNDNNNNSREYSLEETLRRHPANIPYVKRTPLTELLTQSLFSPELLSSKNRKTRKPVTRSLESSGESSGTLKTHIKRKRRHSIGSPYTRTSVSGGLALPLRKPRSTRNRSFVPPTDSSSCDESYALERGQQALQSLLTRSESIELVTPEVDDQWQQFPEGDSNLSPLCFHGINSSSDENESGMSEGGHPNDGNSSHTNGYAKEHIAT